MKKLIVLLNCMLLLLVKTNYSQTMFSGGIFSNTTWTLAGSPYIINGNVTIFAGKTLTINPGVIVQFDPGITFDVRGNIAALGTSTDSVTFTTSATNPFSGAWNGLTTKNTLNSNLTFKFCKFLYASNAIDLYAATNVLLTIEDSRFSYNQRVIIGYSGIAGGSTNYPTLILRSKFTNNMRCFGDFPNIGSAYMTINYCSFFNNSTCFHYTESTNTYNSIFCSNYIAADVISANFDNCAFTNNHIGIREGNLYLYETIINNCILSDNDTGMVFNSIPSPMDSLGGGPFRRNNTFCNNNYSAVVISPYNVDMSGNCWGTTNTSLIDQTIYDGFDNISVGLIQYTPMLNCGANECPSFTTCNAITVGVNDNIKTPQNILVFPNPSSGVFQLKTDYTNFHEFEVVDILGNIILKSNIKSNITNIDLSDYMNGIYLIKIIDNKGNILNEKIIKQ